MYVLSFEVQRVEKKKEVMFLLSCFSKVSRNQPLLATVGGVTSYVWIFFLRPLYIGLPPLPVRVTTRSITFLVGNPYKPSFPLSPWEGGQPNLYKSEVLRRAVVCSNAQVTWVLAVVS